MFVSSSVEVGAASKRLRKLHLLKVSLVRRLVKDAAKTPMFYGETVGLFYFQTLKFLIIASSTVLCIAFYCASTYVSLRVVLFISCARVRRVPHH